MDRTVSPFSAGVRGAGMLVALAVAACAARPHPAAAMCGGNIFATCPPSAKAAVEAERAAKREARLRSVRAKKRHYPLGRK